MSLFRGRFCAERRVWVLALGVLWVLPLVAMKCAPRKSKTLPSGKPDKRKPSKAGKAPSLRKHPKARKAAAVKAGTVRAVGKPLPSAKVVWIPAGSFQMGASPGDGNAGSGEKPRRKVTLTRGFWMWQTEVTQGQYLALMGKNPSRFKGCGLRCPVEKVSWYRAARAANALSKRQGLETCFAADGKNLKPQFRSAKGLLRCEGWRLPTEAEWEQAARAGTRGTRYGALNEVGWYNKNSGRKTHPACL